jgi:hypothetical protein
MFTVSDIIYNQFFLSQQQCIPEDYKRFANKDTKVDVMAFLGIKRAEPLRVQRDWD